MVVSFGTAIDTPLDEDEHPVRAVAAMSAASAPTASFFELRLKNSLIEFFISINSFLDFVPLFYVTYYIIRSYFCQIYNFYRLT